MYDVLTIGTGTRDVFLRSPLFKAMHDAEHLRKLGFPTGEAQCFELGGKIEIEKPVMTIGGGAANAAVTFSRQGFKAAALMKIGNDEHGKAILADVRREKVKALPLLDKKTGSGYSVLLLSHEGERTILTYRGASEDIKKPEVAPTRIPKSQWAYIVSGHIPLEVIQSLMQTLSHRGTRIAFSPSGYHLSLGIEKLGKILVASDVVVLNREEAASLVGISYENKHEVFAKFRHLSKSISIMTDGHKGVWVAHAGKTYQAGVYQEEAIVDRTGAGDAFGSGFVSALIGAAREGLVPTDEHYNDEGEHGEYSEETIKKAIRLGSANGTSVVEYIGAQPGILTKRQFQLQSRWHHFPIRVL